MGIGYIYALPFGIHNANNTSWFSSIEPQLNLYHLASNSIDGDVYRYGSSAFNDMTFDIPVNSTRLMLDAALNLVTWRQLTFYLKGGIGAAWTRVSYQDTDNSGPCPVQNVKLFSNTTTRFVWEAGLGLIFPLGPRVGLSFEYLYANLGNVKTASSGNPGAITFPTLTPVSFRLKTQTALLGLHIAI